jgi:hypothetical protein
VAELHPDNEPQDQVTLARLDAQIKWYDRRSSVNRRLYKLLKTLIIASASAIPVLTTAGLPHGTHLAAGLGVMIAVLEGVQQLNQYQANWANYRMAAEALKHEKYYYLAHAGPYAKAEDPYIMLTERVEQLITQEIANWFSGQAQVSNDTLRTTR